MTDLKMRLGDLLDHYIREEWRQSRKAKARYTEKSHWAEYHERKAAEYQRIAERLKSARIIEGDER